MKKKLHLKILLLTLGIGAIIPNIAMFLTSCSDGMAPHTIYNSKVQKNILIENPGQQLLTKTTSDWAEDIQNNSPTNFINAVIQSCPEYQSLNFIYDNNSYVQSIELNTLTPKSPLLSSIQVTLVNSSTVLTIAVNNLFTFSTIYFNPPTYEYVKLEQINMTVIYDVDPLVVTDADWINQINEIGLGLEIPVLYIPNNLYYITEKGYYDQNLDQFTNSQTSVYRIICNINNQYDNIVDKSIYKPITIDIIVSPYFNKIYQNVFRLDYSTVQRCFGENVSIDTIVNMNQVEVYNKLKEYVDSLETIQPLRNCLLDNNYVYKYNTVNETLTNNLIISFDSVPDANTKNYNYQFILNFNS